MCATCCLHQRSLGLLTNCPSLLRAIAQRRSNTQDPNLKCQCKLKRAVYTPRQPGLRGKSVSPQPWQNDCDSPYIGMENLEYRLYGRTLIPKFSLHFQRLENSQLMLDLTENQPVLWHSKRSWRINKWLQLFF